MAEMSPIFTVTMREQEFRLSRRQIEFDSPNYFTGCFLNGFREASSNSIVLDRNPYLFSIICEYMSGYHILPLSANALPETMDVPFVLRNLLVDAEFYGLSRLRILLTTPCAPPTPLEWARLARRIVTLEQVLGEHLPPGVEYIEGALHTTEDGNPQPVLVFAKDVPIRLAAIKEIEMNHGMNPSIVPDSENVWFTIDYTHARTSEYAAPVKHPPSITAESVFEGGFMHIDGSKRLLSDFKVWWSSIPAYIAVPEETFFGQLHPRQFEWAEEGPWQSYEAVLWADEILFTVTGRSSDAGDPILHIKLANLKARTRAAILDGLSPPCSRWARA